MRAHVPRMVIRRLPDTVELPLASWYPLSLQPSETVPSWFRSVWTGSEPLGNGPLFEFCHDWVVLLGLRCTVAPGNDWCESTAATLMTRSPVDGEPTMYGTVRPALPAEATTTIPDFSAFSDAIASDDSASPKSEPSDMFTTCM